LGDHDLFSVTFLIHMTRKWMRGS